MTTEELKKEILEIATAWLIGLGYTVPPFNGKHSQEFINQLLSLFTSQQGEMRDKIQKIIKRRRDTIHQDWYERAHELNCILGDLDTLKDMEKK